MTTTQTTIPGYEDCNVSLLAATLERGDFRRSHGLPTNSDYAALLPYRAQIAAAASSAERAAQTEIVQANAILR